MDTYVPASFAAALTLLGVDTDDPNKVAFRVEMSEKQIAIWYYRIRNGEVVHNSSGQAVVDIERRTY